jgi:hypothetical protein
MLKIFKRMLSPDPAPSTVKATPGKPKLYAVDGVYTSRFRDLDSANQEVARLHGVLDQVQSKQETAVIGEQAIAEATATLRADLATATSTIGTLRTELSSIKQTMEHTASVRAAAITASQGQPPLSITPTDTPASMKRQSAQKLTGLAKAIACHKSDYGETEKL